MRFGQSDSADESYPFSGIADFFLQGIMIIDGRFAMSDLTFERMGYSRNFYEFVDFDALSKYGNFTKLIHDSDLSEEQRETRPSYETDVYNIVLKSPNALSIVNDRLKYSSVNVRIGKDISSYLVKELFPERRAQALAILKSVRSSIAKRKFDYYNVLSSTFLEFCFLKILELVLKRFLKIQQLKLEPD